MVQKIFLTHSSLVGEEQREKLDENLDNKSCDSIHTVFNHPGEINGEILYKIRSWWHASFAHVLLHCIKWKEPVVMSDCKTGDEFIAILTQDFDYVTHIPRVLEKNKNYFKPLDTKKLQLIVQITTNCPYYNEAVMILLEFFTRYLIDESSRRNFQWCINGNGPLFTNTNTYHLTVHITSSALYTGLRLVEYQWLRPWLSQTSQYGSSTVAVAEKANIAEGSIVLDLNAVVGELLLEVLVLKKCYCIGLVQEYDDAEGALRNFKKFKKWKKDGNPYLDLIAADMREFFNFYAVDHILARCPFRPTRPIFEAQEYFNKLDAILRVCRPNITVTVIYPKSSEYVQIVKDMFVKHTHAQLIFTTFFEEYHRKYGLLQFMTGVFNNEPSTSSSPALGSE